MHAITKKTLTKNQNIHEKVCFFLVRFHFRSYNDNNHLCSRKVSTDMSNSKIESFSSPRRLTPRSRLVVTDQNLSQEMVDTLTVFNRSQLQEEDICSSPDSSQEGVQMLFPKSPGNSLII